MRGLLRALLVLWGAFTLVFVIFSTVPDPARQLAGQQASEQTVAAIRAKHGLDQSVTTRYVRALAALSPIGMRREATTQIGGESATSWGLRAPSLGTSWVSERPVVDVLLEALPGTAILAAVSMVLALLLGLPTGLLAAIRPGSWWDRVVVGGSVLGMSAPSFFVALAVGYVGAVRCYDWTGLPLTGSWIEVDWQNGPRIAWANLILPAITLGMRPWAVLAQLMRGAATDVLEQPHIKTARAFGATNREIVYRHVLRNALNPVLTSASGWMASMLAGAVFVEFVFGWRGLGYTLFDALEQNDLPIVMGGVLFISAMFVMIQAFTDGAYRWLDPRAR